MTENEETFKWGEEVEFRYMLSAGWEPGYYYGQYLGSTTIYKFLVSTTAPKRSYSFEGILDRVAQVRRKLQKPDCSGKEVEIDGVKYKLTAIRG